jgi:predicted kinase
MQKFKELLMTVGLPRSGKSTWAREQGHPIVCPDAIRLALHGKAWEPLAEGLVWAIAKITVRALFIAGHDKVILDATNNTIQTRSEWKSDSWKRKYVMFITPKSECLQRAVETNQEYLIPVIERMAAEQERITAEDLDDPT